MNVLRFTLSFLLMTGLLTAGVWAYGYEKDKGEGQAEGVEMVPDTVITIEPQSFPINELPDEFFGKKVEEDGEWTKSMEQSIFSATEAPVPGYIDEIIFREAVVVFNQQVSTLSPTEEAFKQTTQFHYNSPDEVNGFVTQFETAPSGYQIIVLGAYSSEEENVWMSLVKEAATDVVLMARGPSEEGKDLVLMGTMNGQSFQAALSKATSKLAVQP